jgi:hypothetical protein
MASILEVNTIKDAGNDVAIDMSRIASTGRYSRQIITQVDSGSYSATTTWVLGPTFATITGLQGNSLLKLTYHVPTRNDSTSWGGGYLEPQVRFNGGTWQSLGSGGYDGGVMHLGYATICSYRQTILIDPGLTTAFTAQFRIYLKSYDGTFGLNNALGHEINITSGTATLMPSNNGLQHYMHLIVEEFARYN